MTALIGDVRRIAVLRANAIGDYLMAVPALEALKHAYPGARLTLLGTAWHAGFLTGRPGPVDEVVALPPISGVSTREPGHAAPEELCAGLRQREFDLAVQIHGGGRFSNPFVRRLGARVTAGLRAPGPSGWTAGCRTPTTTTRPCVSCRWRHWSARWTPGWSRG
ncbi:glycosyltransferase family 9 protein [Nonomuraea thailandensis]